MGLADTAKALQEQNISEELKFLKNCRKFCKEVTIKRINQQNKRLCQLYDIGTAEAMQEARKLQGTIVEAAAILQLYKHILEKAEEAEHREKGCGDRYARENLGDWKETLRTLRKECDEIRQIPFDVKEG